MARKPLGDRPMTGAERQRRYRERHALPTPEWQRGLLVLDEGLPLEDVLADEPDPMIGPQ